MDATNETVVGSITIGGREMSIVEKMIDGRKYREVLAEEITVPVLCTYSHVAAILGVSIRTVHRWEKSGDMPKAFRVFRSVRFDLHQILAWLKRRDANQQMRQMKSDEWVNDTSAGASIEEMRAERGLPVSKDVQSEIDLDLAAMKKLLDEMNEIMVGERTKESFERLLKVRAVFESLREKIRPLREATK